MCTVRQTPKFYPKSACHMFVQIAAPVSSGTEGTRSRPSRKLTTKSENAIGARFTLNSLKL